MQRHIFLTLLLVGAALCTPLSSKERIEKRQSDSSLSLDDQLVLATTDIERISLVAAGGDESFVFDFGNPPNGTQPPPGPGGSVVAATAGTFPALIGRQAAAALFILNPCGLVVPHTHPRSNEFILVTQGTVFTQFLTESGSLLISNTLTQYQGTLFPQGSIHLEFNPTCNTSIFTAGFNDNDPGVSAIAPNFLSLDPELIGATLGGDNVISGAELASIEKALPAAVVIQVADCLKTCGIQPNQKRSLKEVLNIS